MDVNVRRSFGWLFAILASLFAPLAARAQSSNGAGGVTFNKDILPILQRSCQECHRPNGAGPMSLVTYEEVRPWARAIKERTHLGPHAGVMPPWFVEKDIGIQKFKSDPSLNEEEIAKIMKWAEQRRAARQSGRRAAAAAVSTIEDKWTIGEPDMVVKSKEVTVPASGPDWWGDVGLIPTGLDEDRYVSAVEVRGSQRRSQKRSDQDRRRAFRLPPHDLYQHCRAHDGGSRRHQLGRFMRSDATRIFFRPKPAGCWPRIRLCR